jgi:hypothetical protein
MTRDSFALEDNWALACTAMPEGSLYLINRDKNFLMQGTWHDNEGFLINGVQGLLDNNLMNVGDWYDPKRLSYISDLSVGSDFSRVYLLAYNGVPRNDDDTLDSLYEAKVICLDVHSMESRVLRTFAYLPCWNIADTAHYGELDSLERARQAMAAMGMGTHSEYIKFLVECSSILSYMGVVYVCVPVFFAPAFMETSVLYAFRESTHELLGVGMLGEATFGYQFDHLRPLKTNMCVIDESLVFRDMRVGKADPSWHRDPDFLGTYNGSITSYQSLARFFLSEEDLDYYKQPYTVCYIGLEELHEQLDGSSIVEPAILEGKDWFNAQAVGNSDFTSIVADHNSSWLYAASENRIFEYKIDFLMVELNIGGRWIPMADIAYPYLLPGGSNVPVRLTNGAEHTKLVNVKFEPDPDGEYVITPSSIPELLPQGTVIGSIAFQPTQSAVLMKKLNYSYSPYI